MHPTLPDTAPQPVNATIERPVLGVVGWSGSGKTTLLEYLLTHLSQQGLRVNAIKHSHHDLILEPHSKDSARMRLAGAGEVLICSPYRYAIVHELRGAPEPSLSQQLARLSPADLCLVEGFKFDPIPKLEVHRPALGNPPLYLHDPYVIAVAADVPAPMDLPPGLCWLDLNAPASILQWLQAALPSWQNDQARSQNG